MVVDEKTAPAAGGGEPAEQAAPVPDRPVGQDGPQDVHILVAEDDFINQIVAKEVLESQGWQVSIAGNGREALEMIARHAPDLVLMDLEMPEMDGLTATRALREAEKQTGSHLPVIAITGHVLEEYQKECFQAGVEGFVEKPWEAMTLIAAVRKHLRLA